MNKDERDELRRLAESGNDAAVAEKANSTSVIELLNYIEELEKVAQSLIELAPQVRAMGKAIELTNEYLDSMVGEARKNPDVHGVLWMMEMIADSIRTIQNTALLGAKP